MLLSKVLLTASKNQVKIYSRSKDCVKEQERRTEAFITKCDKSLLQNAPDFLLQQLMFFEDIIAI